MYAVVENGGKQYRVELGAELELDQFAADPGARVEIGRVLLVADGENALVGTPVVEGAKVTGEVLRADRGEKIIVFKYRPKARRRVKHGHRQELTIVRVADIEWAGRSAAKEAQAAAADAKQAKAEADKSAEAKAKADAALAEKLAKSEKPKAEAKPAAKSTSSATATKSTATKSTATKSTASKSSAAAPKPARSRTKKEE